MHEILIVWLTLTVDQELSLGFIGEFFLFSFIYIFKTL